MTIDDLDRVLCHPNIVDVVSCPVGDELFQRRREFTVHDERFAIEWWVNGSYLYHGRLTIPFKTVRQSGTWPNMAKLNLQFYNDDHRVCCVLEIEQYQATPPSQGESIGKEV